MGVPEVTAGVGWVLRSVVLDGFAPLTNADGDEDRWDALLRMLPRPWELGSTMAE